MTAWSRSSGDISNAPSSDVWWLPGSGLPRVLFMARLREACALALSSQLDTHGVLALLGNEVFPSHLLHQSLSDRYVDKPDIRRRLLLAGDRVNAQAFTLSLDRLQCALNDRGSHNVDVRMHDVCSELKVLVDKINRAIEESGLPMGGGHSPHVTVSYAFTGFLPKLQKIPAINVIVDSFELVVGGGTPYGYTSLGRWMLSQQSPQITQPQLF